MDPQRGNGNLFCCCFQKTLSGSKKEEREEKFSFAVFLKIFHFLFFTTTFARQICIEDPFIDQQSFLRQLLMFFQL